MDEPPHPNRSAVFDPELRPKGAHVEALPLSFDPEALDGEGGGEGGGDFFWLRRSRVVFICVPLVFFGLEDLSRSTFGLQNICNYNILGQR
jgi:hypothetical protein